MSPEEVTLLCAIGEGIRLLLEINVKGSYEDKEYTKVHNELVAALTHCVNQ